jgi:phosphoesterase RecJ-like protein
MEISLRRVAQMLAATEKVVITGHIHPDGDSLGSMLALYASLAAQGKQVMLLLDDEVPAVYRFLPGTELIRRPDGPVEADLLVVLDASDPDRIAGVDAAVKAKMLNIDHHISNTKFADFWYIDSRAAATGEIILELLHLMKTAITADMATNLYTAIATDCGFFRYANATAATLRHAADLIDRGAQPHVIAEQLETKPLASIMTLRSVLDSLEIHAGGRIAAVTVEFENGGDGAAESTEGYINYPRNIEGVEIAIMFKPADNSATRVSFRSRRCDVSRLALAFGGGGHARAAGCTVGSGLPAAKEEVLRAAERLLAESGL